MNARQQQSLEPDAQAPLEDVRGPSPRAPAPAPSSLMGADSHSTPPAAAAHRDRGDSAAPPAGLWAKLHKIRCAAPRELTPDKKGPSAQGAWPYVSADAVLRELAPLFEEHRVLVIPEVRDDPIARTFKVGNEGKENVATEVPLRFTLVDVDTGEERSFDWLGAGQDSAEKGAPKAQTSGLRTWLEGLFQITQADTSVRGDPARQQPGKATAAQQQQMNTKAAGKLNAREYLNVLLITLAVDPVDVDEDTALKRIGSTVAQIPAEKVPDVLMRIDQYAVETPT